MVPFTVAHAKDPKYIVKTAAIVGILLEQLRKKMLNVVKEIGDDSVWRVCVVNEMNEFLKCSDFVRLTKVLMAYKGDTAIQAVFTWATFSI